MKTLIKDGLTITMDPKRKEKYEKLDILINDDKIEKITKNYQGEYDKLIDAKNKIVMPGLINAHTHLGMSIFRATNDNLTLQDWLEKKIWPIENNMTDEDVYYSALLSCLEMIKTGTTCASDMYFGYKGTMKAVKDSKIRIAMSRCLIGDADKDGLSKIKEFKALIKEYKNNPLVTFTITPHSMYTCTKKYLKECEKLARETNLPIHMHFCENEEEVKIIKENYQKSPVEALQELGFLSHKLILAHGTFIEEKEQEILKDKEVSIVTNPLSNLNLGCGIADVTSYKKHNINICLGTDGQGSGNNLNLFKHMSLVANLQKALYKDPTVISSYEVLQMATINSAKALGLEEKIGSLEEGKQADIIILDLDKIGTFPTPELFPQIVNNIEESNILTTIINGEIIMENKKLNIEIDKKDLQENIKKIYTRLKI